MIEAYKDTLISAGRAKELLNFSTRLELDAFLKAHEVYLHYDLVDLEQDLQTMEHLQQVGQH